MNKNRLTYDDILSRIGFFRAKANLSQREVSLRMGFAENYMKRLENKNFELKVSTLLDFLDVVEITAQDFFYLGHEFSKEDKNLLEMFSALTAENKATIVDLMKKLK